jgi:ubiquinone/menaquinone biosynthesis C-methylase UbiE
VSRGRDVAAFDRRGPGYERGWLTSWHSQITATSADVASRAAPDARRVLDVGCGTGALLRALADRLPAAIELVGVDPAAGMIAAGRAQPALDPRIQLSEAAAEQLPHPDASFHLVVSTMSFDHWANQGAGVAEVARVLIPGSPFVLVDLCASWLGLTVAVNRRPRARTRHRIERLLTAADLLPQRWERVYDLGRLGLVQAVVAACAPGGRG